MIGRSYWRPMSHACSLLILCYFWICNLIKCNRKTMWILICIQIPLDIFYCHSRQYCCVYSEISKQKEKHDENSILLDSLAESKRFPLIFRWTSQFMEHDNWVHYNPSSQVIEVRLSWIQLAASNPSAIAMRIRRKYKSTTLLNPFIVADISISRVSVCLCHVSGSWKCCKLSEQSFTGIGGR